MLLIKEDQLDSTIYKLNKSLLISWIHRQISSWTNLQWFSNKLSMNTLYQLTRRLTQAFISSWHSLSSSVLCMVILGTEVACFSSQLVSCYLQALFQRSKECNQLYRCGISYGWWDFLLCIAVLCTMISCHFHLNYSIHATKVETVWWRMGIAYTHLVLIQPGMVPLRKSVS